MKIRYVTNLRIPTEKAYGFQISKMCEQLALQGAEVELWSPQLFNSIEESVFDYYALNKTFLHKQVSGLYLHSQEMFAGIIFLYNFLVFCIKLVFILPSECIVFTRNPLLAFISRIKNKNTIYECHDWFGRSKLISLLLLKRIKIIITTNNLIKREFIKNGFFNVHTLPNGVDIDVFSSSLSKEEATSRLVVDRDMKKIISNSKVVFYSGNFTTFGEKKGIDDILLSLKFLPNNFIFIAVGGRSKEIEDYSRKIRGSRLENRAFLFPRVKQSQLAIFQKACDFLLLPFPDNLHYRYFMSPLKIFEYMAGEKPIIASNLPSIKEILNNDNCIFFKPNNFNDLATKIRAISSDDMWAKKIAQQARKDVEQYSWKNRAKEILELIKNF